MLPILTDDNYSAYKLSFKENECIFGDELIIMHVCNMLFEGKQFVTDGEENCDDVWALNRAANKASKINFN